MAYQFEGKPLVEKIDDLTFKGRLDRIVRDAKTIVYVGWRSETGYALFHWLYEHGKKVIMIEAFQSNVNDFDSQLGHDVGETWDWKEEKGWHNPPIMKMHADARDLFSVVSEVERDCLIWQDGPEHLEMWQAVGMLKQFQESFDSIIISTPDGPYKQGILDGNVWEQHRSTWYRTDYLTLGFEVCGYEAGLIGFWRRA